MAKKFLQDQDSIANVTGDIDLYFESKVTNQLLTATGPNDRDKVVVLPQRQACPPPPPPPPSPGAGLQQWWVDTYKRDNFQFFLKVKGDKKDVNKPVECPVGDDTQAFINVQGDAVANCGIQVWVFRWQDDKKAWTICNVKTGEYLYVDSDGKSSCPPSGAPVRCGPRGCDDNRLWQIYHF